MCFFDPRRYFAYTTTACKQRTAATVDTALPTKPVRCIHILKATPHPCLQAVQVKQAILVKIPHFAYNFTWRSSSAGVLSKTFFIAQPTPPEGIWSRDKTYVGNAQLFHWVIHTFPPVASWAHTPQYLPNASLKSLIYWDCTNQRHRTCKGQCSHLPPALEPTEDSSQGRVDAHVQSSFPGALREPGAIRCRPQNKLPELRCLGMLYASTPQ